MYCVLQPIIPSKVASKEENLGDSTTSFVTIVSDFEFTIRISQTTPKFIGRVTLNYSQRNLIFVVPCIMLNSEINPTRCNNCVYYSQWLYSTCFG